DSGTVQFTLFDNGELAADTGIGTGFVYDGWNGAFEGTFLVGQSFTQVSGEAYEGQTGAYEWVNTTPIVENTPNLNYSVSFNDSAALGDGPIGADVSLNAYTVPDAAFVIIDAEVTNSSGGNLAGVYIGIFQDWDVGYDEVNFPNEFDDDLACFDDDSNLL